MGFTKENPPKYMKPLLEEYSEIKITSCEPRHGQYVGFVDRETGETYKFNRGINFNIKLRRLDSSEPGGTIETGVTENSFGDVTERDELIGEELEERLCGYSSFDEAVNSEF